MPIDCHAHWIPPPVAQALRSRVETPRIVAVNGEERLVTHLGSRRFDAGLCDLDARRAHMQQHGVDMQVLSLAGLFGIDCLPVAQSERIVSAFNDAALEAQNSTPRQFAALAALPLAHMDRACRELERVVAAGMQGAILPADGFATVPEAKRFAGLFEIGEQAKCHFFIHPGPVAPPVPAPLADDEARQRRIVLGVQARLSEAMVTLNLSGFLDAYPNVTVQVANLGGTIPFLVERMDQVARTHAEMPPPSRRLARCYVDTASFGPRAIEMAVACFGAERVLLGTDCPIFDTGTARDAISDARLESSERERIETRNAERLFRKRAELGCYATNG